MKLGIISDLRNPQHPRFHRPWVQHYHEFLDFIAGERNRDTRADSGKN